MTGLEIVLLIVGFFCLCISFFVARRAVPEKSRDDAVQASTVWTEKEEEMIRERVNEILSDRQNQLVDTTEEQMNRLCNDKIMAVDEFSRQILEKIENNHQEVVFMYNMLNEKEKEVKNVILQPVKMEEEPVVVETPQTAISRLTAQGNGEEKKKPVKVKEERKTVAQEKLVRDPARKTAEVPKVEEKHAVPVNINDQIRKMHQEGKSVLEISKELNIGQGEVKLVIALYGGKKK